MLTEDELGRVCVVLVRARNPSNIGAAARAMHDFGFGCLRIVNEYVVPFEAARSAVDATEVVERAVVYGSVAEAVADCTLVVGTTAVGERQLRHELLPLHEAAVRMRAELRSDPIHHDGAVMSAAPGCKETHISEARCGAPQVGVGRVALLFGSEKTGLSNQELSYCHCLLTVPMREHAGMRHSSMNLGQAVAVCLYELGQERDADDAGLDRATRQGAPAAGLERLSALLGEVLETTGYARRHAGNSDPEQVRRLVRRMGLDANELTVWMGILRQTMRKIGGEPEE